MQSINCQLNDTEHHCILQPHRLIIEKNGWQWRGVSIYIAEATETRVSINRGDRGSGNQWERAESRDES